MDATELTLTCNLNCNEFIFITSYCRIYLFLITLINNRIFATQNPGRVWQVNVCHLCLQFHIHMQNIRMQESYVHKIRMQESHMKHINMQHIRMQESHMHHIRLQESHMQHIRLLESHMQHIRLLESHMQHIRLLESHMQHIRLLESHMQHIRLLESHMQHTRLQERQPVSLKTNNCMNEIVSTNARVILYVIRMRLIFVHLTLNALKQISVPCSAARSRLCYVIKDFSINRVLWISMLREAFPHGWQIP